MATFDSAWCLTRFNQLTQRPPTGDSITDAAKYLRLSASQNRVIALMSVVAPNALYPHVGYTSLPTLTTTDNQVYTFGTDTNGYAKFPMGKGGIYQSLNDIPNYPLVPGRDYMVEGTQIRALNNTTLPSVLYWYGISQPDDITAAVQPAIMPEAARELIVIDAARQFSLEGKRDDNLSSTMASEWANAWPIWCGVWKTQYRSGGALDALSGLSLAIATGGAAQPGY